MDISSITLDNNDDLQSAKSLKQLCVKTINSTWNLIYKHRLLTQQYKEADILNHKTRNDNAYFKVNVRHLCVCVCVRVTECLYILNKLLFQACHKNTWQEFRNNILLKQKKFYRRHNIANILTESNNAFKGRFAKKRTNAVQGAGKREKT